MTNQLKTVLCAWLILSVVAFSNIAQAQDGAALYAGKACLACHGPTGNEPINDNTPKIAGQNKGYLVQQMMDIKSGARNNGLSAQMKGIVSGVSDEEIEAIAGYLSGF